MFCAQVNDSGRAALLPWRTNVLMWGFCRHLADLPHHLGWTGGFIITSLTHAGGFGVTLPACSVAAVGLGFSPRPSTMLRHHFIKPSSLLGHLGTGLGAGISSRHNLGLRHQHRAH